MRYAVVKTQGVARAEVARGFRRDEVMFPTMEFRKHPIWLGNGRIKARGYTKMTKCSVKEEPAADRRNAFQ